METTMTSDEKFTALVTKLCLPATEVGDTGKCWPWWSSPPCAYVLMCNCVISIASHSSWALTHKIHRFFFSQLVIPIIYGTVQVLRNKGKDKKPSRRHKFNINYRRLTCPAVKSNCKLDAELDVRPSSRLLLQAQTWLSRTEASETLIKC